MAPKLIAHDPLGEAEAILRERCDEFLLERTV